MKVVTIGLGYIGLPTSAIIASHDIEVLGVDLDETVVDTINKGEVHIIEPDLDCLVREVVNSGRMVASTAVDVGDVYLVVVPTPLKDNLDPDISYIEAATKSIIPLLKKGDLFIIESTSPVGTTESIQELIYNEREDLKEKIFIAYCPERVLPGNVLYELVNNDRVVGGVDEKSTAAAKKFYKTFVKGEVHTTNSKTAEMCKLVENSSRDVQIAFANELSIICEKADIDVLELIALANKHPRVNILQPGCGVGGHCIAVDPYFIVSNFHKESNIIRTAREVNNFKPHWCVDRIRSAIKEFELKTGRIAKVGLLGLSFKPNIDDLRESPAEQIAYELKKFVNAENIFVSEPNISAHKDLCLTEFGENINTSDIIVFLVSHDEFKKVVISDEKKVLDFCGVRN